MNVTRIVFEATSDPDDFTFGLTNAGLFAGLEVYIGIITACLPTLGPLIVRELHSFSVRQAKVCTPARPNGSLGFRAPPKLLSNSYGFDVGSFDQLAKDDIPLRGTATIVQSNSDISPSQSLKRVVPDGQINVRTHMQVFKSSTEEC